MKMAVHNRRVFSSRIYVADSRRDSIYTDFGKRGMTGVIGIPVNQELSEHLLDIIQGFLLSPGSPLLCLHPPTEIIIIVVGHVSRHETFSRRADCGRRGISAGFLLIIRPLEKISQWCRQHGSS